MLIVHSCMCPILLLVTQKASVGMYSGCDKLSRLQILFVYFLTLPFLLHPLILFNCFLYLIVTVLFYHVLFDPAIPTSSFNFIQLFFILVTVLFYHPQGNS